jgi:hypothetical protein
MPSWGRKEFDTSSWGEKDWRSARRWNAGFLVVWTIFIFAAAYQAVRNSDWYGLAFLLAIAVAGISSTVVWLIRISIWLNKR